MSFRTLQAVVFDWAGTVIDFGSQAPMGAFVVLFARHNVAITMAEARGPMGLPKWHHIQALGQQPRIAAAWQAAHGRAFTDADAEAGDFLFKLDANTLSGKSDVAKGTLCLFRPFVGEPTKTDIYLIRRTGGGAFGATRASWTVGMLQALDNDQTRVRYRAASHHMECSSQLVQPSNALIAVAQFIKAIH